MKRLKTYLLVLCFASAAWAQAPVAEQPQPKSQKELEALQAVFAAIDNDSRIKRAEDVLTNYADTEFRSLMLEIITMAYSEKNDYEKTVVYGERCLEVDPNNYRVMLILGQAIAQRTKEFDLDREEKLKRCEGYAAKAQDLVAKAPKPNPQITDEQWEAAKKDTLAEVRTVNGLVALARKKYDVAATEFKAAVDTASNSNPTNKLQLGLAYVNLGKYDDALALFDQVINDPNLPPVFKQFAQGQKNEALKKKAAAAPAQP